jgi:hypothetical protein
LGHARLPSTLTQARRKTKGPHLIGPLVALLLSAAAPARAQLGVSAAVGAGVNNNNVHVKPEPGVAPAETEFEGNQADGLLRTTLGAHYLTRGGRATHHLEYLLSTYIYLQRSQSVSFANELGWTGLINPTRFSALDFSLRGTQGQTNDLDLFRGQELGDSAARRVTSERFLSLSGGEHLRWELGPDWELGQRLESELYLPIGDARKSSPRTIGASAGLGLDRVWLRDQLGVFVEAGHGRSSEVIFEEPMEGLLGFPARRANYGRAGLSWGHAFSDYWTTHVDAGVLGVQVPQLRDPFIDLGASLTISHRTETRGTVALRAERGVDTNVYVGDVLLMNGIGLRADVPFGHKEIWHLEADVELQQSESVYVIDVKDNLKVFSTSAILGYDFSRHASLLFELNFTYQDAEAGLRNTLRTEPFTSHRTMFVVSIDMHYPQPEDDERGGGRRLSGRGGDSSLDDEPEEGEEGTSEESSSESTEEGSEEGTSPP